MGSKQYQETKRTERRDREALRHWGVNWQRLTVTERLSMKQIEKLEDMERIWSNELKKL